MKVITCPEPIELESGRISLFLAGGIVGCSDWQSEMLRQLDDCAVTVFNPRRPSFPIHDPNAAPEQIQWEFKALRKADIISFWFDEGVAGASPSPQPIAMFEYGWWLNKASLGMATIFVGCHPKYIRRLDVEYQTRLAAVLYAPLANIEIVNNLDDLAEQIRDYVRKGVR